MLCYLCIRRSKGVVVVLVLVLVCLLIHCSRRNVYLLKIGEKSFRTFVRIQRVIWDHLLASKTEIIHKQGSF